MNHLLLFYYLTSLVGVQNTTDSLSVRVLNKTTKWEREQERAQKKQMK
jgi:hypothetical protein